MPVAFEGLFTDPDNREICYDINIYDKPATAEFSSLAFNLFYLLA